MKKVCTYFEKQMRIFASLMNLDINGSNGKM